MTKPKKTHSGTQARALEDVARYMDDPTKSLVPSKTAGNLPSTVNMDVSIIKMYADGGHKLETVAYLAARGQLEGFPKTSDDLFESLQLFFGFCGANYVPPTISLFALWNGVSMRRVDQIENNRSDDRSSMVGVCKEAIRSFLELAAMEGSLQILTYFHHQKAYFGVVENKQVTVRVEDNRSEITDAEFNERIVQLTQDENGVWSEPTNEDDSIE